MAEKNTPPGPAVDASGQTVIDPTDNVLREVAAANKRQDDLRDMQGRHDKEVREIVERYEEKLRVKESARIDANRSQDQDNARRAAETALAAVQALATQVPITADTVRAASTASLTPIQERLTQIERIQYEQAGQKQQVSDTQVDRRAGTSQTWVIVGVLGAVVFGALGTLISVGSLVYLIVHG
jgi:hypothetical protein